MLPFYDRTESRYPIVDNIAEEGVGAKFVAAASGVDQPEPRRRCCGCCSRRPRGSSSAWISTMATCRRRHGISRSIRGDLAAFVSGSLPADDPLLPLVKKISPATCGRRWCDVERSADRRRLRLSCGHSTRAAAHGTCADATGRRRAADRRVPAPARHGGSGVRVLLALARSAGGAAHHAPPGLDVIVFGHTHLLDRPFRPFGEDGPVVVTSGAWQRTIHPNDITKLDAPLESLPRVLLVRADSTRRRHAHRRVALVAAERAAAVDDRERWLLMRRPPIDTD